MRIIFCYVFFLSFLTTENSSGQAFSWAQGFTTTGGVPVSSASVVKATLDTGNNIYSIGNFTGTIDLDQGPNVYNITSVQPGELFLLKEDAAGNFLWAKVFHRKSNVAFGINGTAISLDIHNNIYVSGTFSDTVDFDPGPNTFYMMPPISSVVNFNGFIVKLDPNGNFIWAKQIGGGAGSSAGFTDMKINTAGNLILQGAISNNSTIDVDPGSNVVNFSGGGLLIEELDTAGNFIWAKHVIGAGPTGLALDSNSNLYITGGFQDTVDFDPGPGVAKLFSGSSAGSAIFVAKYDSAGNYSWVKQVGVAGNNARSEDISLDPFGNVLVTGYFGSIVDFDPGPGVYNLTSNSTRSIFTLRLRNNGDFSWASMAGGPVGLFYGQAVATDSAGSVYTASVAPGGCDLDPGPAVYNVQGDCVVQKLDSSGNFVWGAGWQADAPGWIGLDHDNSVYTTGTFSGTNKDFDPGPGSFLLSGSINGSGFIHKLIQSPVNSIADNVRLTSGINVYPNPSSGRITLSSSAVINRIDITDITGKNVFTTEPDKTEITINLSDQASGMYFCIITVQDKKIWRKLIISTE